MWEIFRRIFTGFGLCGKLCRFRRDSYRKRIHGATVGFAKASIYGSGYYPYIHVMDDDVHMTVFKKDGITDLINEMVPYKNFYDWSDQLTINPKTDEEWEDNDWEKMYSHIAYLNVIIAHVKKFSHDSVETRNRVEGEARFLRGAYYYLLTNLYANPYVKESASSDMGSH